MRTVRAVRAAALALTLFGATWTTPATAAEFNYRNALVAYIVLSGDRSLAAPVDEWMQQFRPEVWARYGRDEFQLDARRAEMRRQIDSDLASFSTSEPFVITTGATFGEYDFNRSVFEFNPLSENQYFSVTGGGRGGLPRELQLYLANPEFVDGLKIPVAQAPQFLQAHPARQVQIVIRARPTSVPGERQILATIEAVTVRDPTNAGRVLQEVRARPAP